MELKKKQFIAVGRFVDQKCFPTLIKAFALIQSQIPDWNLTILGDGDGKEDALKLVKNLKIQERTSMPGFVSNVDDYLHSAAVFVSSSKWEGMPLTVLEAMRAGLPIVAFGIKAIKNIVKNDFNGILVDLDTSYKGLSNAMLEIAVSNQKRARMSNNSKHLAQNYTPLEILPLWNSLFLKCYFEKSNKKKILYENSHSIIYKMDNFLMKKNKMRRGDFLFF